MHDLDALGCEEVHDRNEVLVRGHQDRGIVIVSPGQADHGRRNVSVNAFFFGAAHVGTASRAG